MGEQATESSPFIQSFSSGDLLGGEPSRRTGNVWSAVSHIITGLIGTGVLSLAWSVAQLGWIAGPLCLICFASITLVSSFLMCDCYRYPHPEHGTIRNSSYVYAVKMYLGDTSQKVCGVLAHVSLYGSSTAYILTTGTCFRPQGRFHLWGKVQHISQPFKHPTPFNRMNPGLILEGYRSN